jgi:hypothetical protein
MVDGKLGYVRGPYDAIHVGATVVGLKIPPITIYTHIVQTNLFGPISSILSISQRFSISNTHSIDET